MLSSSKITLYRLQNSGVLDEGEKEKERRKERKEERKKKKKKEVGWIEMMQ